MRNWLLVLCLCTAFLSRADYWDNLSYSEAEMVVAELKKNPYIFSYCDCCGSELFLVEVLSTEIVACSWLEGAYSVRYTYRALVDFERNGKDAEPENPQMPGEEALPDLIYMNYTWTLDPTTGKAAPFFRAIPYSYYENTMCSEPFDYPSPKKIRGLIKRTGYKKWYAQQVATR